MRRGPIATFLALAFTGAAHADMGIGGLARSGQTAAPLRIFDPDAQGSAPAAFELSGPATGFVDPQWAVYEPNERVLYVSDFNGRAIRVYPAFVSGNVAPLRVLNPALISQTRANAPVPAHGELGVIINNCCIYTYPLLGNGDMVPSIRGINWGGSAGSSSQLNNPGSLIYLPGSDEYAVSDVQPGTNTRRIVFHARTASGNVAPTRMITGPAVAGANGIAHDPATHLLYVLATTTLVDFSIQGRIAVFADTASGDATPLYQITGNTTQLARPAGHYFVGIGHDRYTRRIMVSSGTSSSDAGTHRVVVFNEDAVGNAEPPRDLAGPTLSPGFIGTPFGVPSYSVIYRNGFDFPPK